MLEKPDQFRPGPPPGLTSDVWARDVVEIAAVGGEESTVRTAEQTDIARFWSVVGPASWSPLLRAVTTATRRWWGRRWAGRSASGPSAGTCARSAERGAARYEALRQPSGRAT